MQGRNSKIMDYTIYWPNFSKIKENITSNRPNILICKYGNECPLLFSELRVILCKTFELNKVFSN